MSQSAIWESQRPRRLSHQTPANAAGARSSGRSSCKHQGKLLAYECVLD